MAAPKPFASSETEAPREFFKKQLAGEVPVSFPTAKRLFEKAAELMAIRPWQFLEDQDLILLKSPLSDETCYCSVMGALGQVFSLHAYVRSEEHTSELQSRLHLVCRLLLEKKEALEDLVRPVLRLGLHA